MKENLSFELGEVSESKEIKKTLGRISLDDYSKFAGESQAYYREIRNEIVENNLRLVGFSAKHYMNMLSSGTSCIDFDDLYQAGVEGLIKAANDFDPSKNTKLSTYARYMIGYSIMDYINEMQNDLTIGNATYSGLSRVENRLNGGEKEKDIAESLGVDVSRIREMHGHFERLLVERLNPRLAESVMDSSNGADVENLVIDDVLKEDIEKMLDQKYKNKNKLYIIKSLLNMDGGKSKSQTEIGQELNCSQSYVGSVYREGLEYLERNLPKLGIER